MVRKEKKKKKRNLTECYLNWKILNMKNLQFIM